MAGIVAQHPGRRSRHDGQEEAPMTPEDPESRRIADERKRRERQKPRTGASVDPATLQAILEQHAGAVATS